MAGVPGPNLGLYLGWAEHENGWGPPMNSNLRGLDSLVQLSVMDLDLATPPGSPAEGDRYETEVALFADGAWIFFPAREGWLAWAADEDKLYSFDGSAWTAFTGSTTPAASGPMGQIVLLPDDFAGDGATTTRGAGDEQLPVRNLYGASDRNEVAYFVAPSDFSAIDTVKLYYCNTATATDAWVCRLGLRVLSDGADGTAAPTYGIKATITPPATIDQVDVVELDVPTLTIAPGDLVGLLIQRPAATDGDDVNTDPMAVAIAYT
jgi:hypothetical protein